MHYAALSALSCVHEDVRVHQCGHCIEAEAPAFLRALVAQMPHYTKRNVRQALETLVQAVQAVTICMEDRDVIQVCILSS